MFGQKNCCSNSCDSTKSYCINRFFRDQVGKLSAILYQTKLEEFGEPVKPVLENPDELKYKNYNYNGSFHKGLEHNLVDGRLVSSANYEQMVRAIVFHDQAKLNAVPQAVGATVKLSNPLASEASVLITAEQGMLKLVPCPSLSSNAAAAEMVEVYAQVVARDIAFIDYATDPTIASLLQSNSLNSPQVLTYIKYANVSPFNPFTPQNIFRGNSYGDELGPYISQYLLLTVVEGALKAPQKYVTPPTRAQAITGGFRVEWGVSMAEAISIQNVNLTLLPPATPAIQMSPKYLNTGRSMAEAVHNDAAYQFQYQAALVLNSLGANANPGWPIYSNQVGYITGNGLPSLLCAIADVANYALKHAWYWKWQHDRRVRPEAFGIWVNDILNGLVPNKDNFDIKSTILDNQVLADVYAINNQILPNANSYTLPLAYREGSPTHPSYIAGHAILAGACATVMKCYFDGEQSWFTLPGVITGALSGIPNAIVQSSADGLSLLPYTGADAANITVGTELNKLAANIAIGRDWAGVHYRSDGIAGLQLGEQVAISYMSDLLSTMVENNPNGTVPTIPIRLFNGTKATVKPTLCK